MEVSNDKTQALVAKFAAIDAILEQNNHDPSRMIPILQKIQEIHKYLPKEAITYVASALKVPASRVYGVATFYAHFSLDPKGKHIIRVCDGTACHVKKSHGTLDMLSKKLGISTSKPTTDDMMFTLEIVSCLGACGLAPVVVIDEEVHGQSTPQGIEAIIDGISAAEKAAAAEGGK